MKHLILLYYFISFCSIFFVISVILLSLYKTKEKIIILVLILNIQLLLFIIFRIIIDYYNIININNIIISFIINLFDVLISTSLIAVFVYFTHSLFLIPFKLPVFIGIFIISLIIIVQDIISFNINHFSEINSNNYNIVEMYSLSMIVYSFIVMLVFIRNIKNEFNKKLGNAFLIYTMILIPASITDSFHHINPVKIFFLPLSILIANIVIIRFFIINIFIISREADDISDEFIIRYNITAREKEIIFLLQQGLSYNKISDKAFISLSTVKTHIYNIYQKAGIKSRHQLINLLKK